MPAIPRDTTSRRWPMLALVACAVAMVGTCVLVPGTWCLVPGQGLAADDSVPPHLARGYLDSQHLPLLQRIRHLARLGADRWHTAGHRGRGVKIAILDTGFRGYRDALGKALPAH